MLSFLSRFLFGSPEKPEEKWQSHDNPPQKFEIQNNPIMARGGDGVPIQGYNLPSAQPPPMEKWQSGETNYAYGHPIQGYNLPSAQPPPMNQNKPQIRNVKKIANSSDLIMGSDSRVECNYEDKQPHKPFTPADQGVNEPIIEGADEISNKGKIIMGSSSSITISSGKRAPK